MRALVLLGGLIAAVAITVVGGQWLVPTKVVPTAFGLEVEASVEPPLSTAAAVDPITITAPVVAQAPTEPNIVARELAPTFNWINAFSENSRIDGVPLPVGSTVDAFDPDGALAGRFTVIREGVYGLMAVYMDDPATEADEGAVAGDTLRFEVDGYPAEIVGPDTPVWTENGGLLRLDLVADSGS